MAALLAISLAVTACAADPGTPELNEFGIPVDPTNNMVLPVLVGLIVATLLLIAAAYAVWRLGRRKDALPKPDRPDAWWNCASCATLNTGDRATCFSCHAVRPSEPSTTRPAG